MEGGVVGEGWGWLVGWLGGGGRGAEVEIGRHEKKREGGRPSLLRLCCLPITSPALTLLRLLCLLRPPEHHRRRRPRAGLGRGPPAGERVGAAGAAGGVRHDGPAHRDGADGRARRHLARRVRHRLRPRRRRVQGSCQGTAGCWVLGCCRCWVLGCCCWVTGALLRGWGCSPDAAGQARSAAAEGMGAAPEMKRSGGRFTITPVLAAANPAPPPPPPTPSTPAPPGDRLAGAGAGGADGLQREQRDGGHRGARLHPRRHPPRGEDGKRGLCARQQGAQDGGGWVPHWGWGVGRECGRARGHWGHLLDSKVGG